VTVRTLFDGEVHVHCGQVSVESGPETAIPPLDAAFASQVNGLCGAASRGALFLVTGLHTGHVGFAVKCYAAAPLVVGSEQPEA
jgi:hypothetical protein